MEIFLICVIIQHCQGSKKAENYAPYVKRPRQSQMSYSQTLDIADTLGTASYSIRNSGDLFQ